ncbi:MAG TPA: 5'-methylthioadenosine/S-adenosylhomocysteine nucleosidase [Gemmata sp.]
MPPSKRLLPEHVLEEIDAFNLAASQGTPIPDLIKQFGEKWKREYGSRGEKLLLRLLGTLQARADSVVISYTAQQAVALVTGANKVLEKQFTPTVGIITALPKEFAAVECLLGDPHEVMKRGRRYTQGTIPAAGGNHAVVLVLLPDMGNNMATSRATLLTEHYPDIDIIMTGIAGGVPHPEDVEHHVRLGDIVVSNRNGVVQYDNLKSERKEDIVVDTVRAAPRPPSAFLLEAVRHLDARILRAPPPWYPLIDRACPLLKCARPADATDVLHHTHRRAEIVPHPQDERREPGRPLLFQGPIAAANILLKDPVRRDNLRAVHKVKAVEMEGSGVADATWLSGNGYLVVRGICDYCDMSKGDAWQQYAAIVAAAYTVALIASMPIPSA